MSAFSITWRGVAFSFSVVVVVWESSRRRSVFFLGGLDDIFGTHMCYEKQYFACWARSRSIGAIGGHSSMEYFIGMQFGPNGSDDETLPNRSIGEVF